MSHPQSYEILLVPAFADGKGAAGEGAGTKDSGTGESGVDEPDTKDAGPGSPGPGEAIRSAVVAATGETGESGYPRYAGDGMVADIDPATHTVEALLIDGSELDYGLSVRVSERNVDGDADR
ncbi:hypothetical protein ABZ454_04820 [Streptomyces sp. NPDC005803]|uniref:hypothetical protein n=1 Tax=Streptomyces sp. NPDC005803 TaxID=3154297 RepID=UPI003409E7E0